MPFLLAGLLGVFTGLRTMTPVAVLCWYAYLHALHLEGWQAFLAHIVSAILFTVLALGEYAGDKLPNTPSRTGAVGLAGRALFGGFLGYVVAQPLGSSPVVSLLCGVLGAVVGAYSGWFVRTRSVAALRTKDAYVAVAEDCITITGSILVLNAVVAAARTSF